MKKTKIIATLWPVTANEKSIIKLYNEWVNVIRFNFSHADYEWTKNIVKLINELNNEWKTELSILLDTKWPEIRSWVVKEKIKIEKWKKYKIFVKEKLAWKNDIYCDYKYLIEDVKKWQKIIIDSWLLQTIVTKVHKNYVEVEAKNSIELGSKRHINLPWVKLKLPGITSQDRKDIEFALENKFDYIAASFIRSKEWIKEIYKLFKKYDNPYIKLISKIENEEAIENLDEIIKHSDWIMVARWDLWIEVPIEKLPVYQDEIVRKSKEYWKFVIIATHLLETMIENPFPTRAESSDVFNSVLKWPDALMLSWETTVWKFPIDSVKMMTKIIKEAEKHITFENIKYSNEGLEQSDIEKKYLISYWVKLWQDIEADALVVMTKSWLLARLTSLYRPTLPVYAFTNYTETVNKMRIYYWITPIHLENWNKENFSETLDNAIKYLLKNKLISKKSKIIAITDLQREHAKIPVIEIINIGDFY